MIPRIRVLLAIALLVGAALPGAVQAQYMYLDSNGDGVHSEADVVDSTGVTTADVWLVTDHDRDGSQATCSTADGELKIYSYVVVLRALGGTVEWGTWENGIPEFGLSLPQRRDSTDFHGGAFGLPPLAPGRHRLATIRFTVRSGAPEIAIVSPSPLTGDATSFGSPCSGLDFDNTLKLDSDWFDADGLGWASRPSSGPVFELIPDMALDENTTLVQPVVATDPDGDAPVLSLYQAPTFVSLSDAVSVPGRAEADLRLAPTLANAGTYRIVVRAADPTRRREEIAYVTVRNVNRPLSLGSPRDTTIEVGARVDVTVDATDPDGDPIQMTLVDHPPFASFTTAAIPSGTRGIVRFEPLFADTGAWPVSLAASDGTVQLARSFQVTVTNSGLHLPPVFDPLEVVWMDEGEQVFREVRATDPQGGPVTLRLLEAPHYVYVPYGGTIGGLGLFIEPGVHDSGTAVVRVEALSRLPLRSTAEFQVHVRDKSFPPVLLGPTEICLEPGQTRSYSVFVSARELDTVWIDTGPLPYQGGFTWYGGGSGLLTFTADPEQPPASFTVDVYLNRGTQEEAHWAVTGSVVPYDGCPPIGIPYVDVLPVAIAGGPYAGVAGAPVAFHGTTSPPTLPVSAFRWTFGDGHAALASDPTHAYAEGGTYRAIARMEADSRSRDTTTVVIADALPALAVPAPESAPLVLASSLRLFCFSLRPVGKDYQLADFDPAGVRLWVLKPEGADSILASGEATPAVEGDGVPTLRVCFARSDLERLFADVRARATVEVRLQGRLRNGARVRAPFSLEVVGGAPRPDRVTITPNPMKAGGWMTFETPRPGRVRVRLYDIRGRLVRTLVDETRPEGFVDLRFDGRDRLGRALGSGVYYYRVEAEGFARSGRFTILR